MTVKRNNALIFIFITILIDSIGFGIIIPVMPDLIMSLTHCNPTKAAVYGGWLNVCYAIMQFFCSPIMGNLSDRYGRRPVLLFSLFGLGIDYIFQAFSPTLAWLFLGRIIAGIGGASFTTGTAYIADISTPEKRGQNFGLVGAAFGLGFIIGPAIGGLMGKIDVRAPFMLAAAFSLLNCLYGYFILPESLLKENRRKFEWRRANPIGSLMHLKSNPVLSGLIVSIVLIYLAAHSVQSTWPFFTTYRFGWSREVIGYSLTVVGILIAIVQGGLIRKIIPLLGEKNSVYVGFALYTIGLVLFAFATQGWMMFVFILPYCLGGIAGPALQGIMSSQVPVTEQGELQGALTSLMSLTSIFGPLIMNNVFAWFSDKEKSPVYFPGAHFLLGAICMLLSLLFAINSLKSWHLSTKTAEAEK
jgi:DHA1 family tetracycline resistance protein-like MFS transporter